MLNAYYVYIKFLHAYYVKAQILIYL